MMAVLASSFKVVRVLRISTKQQGHNRITEADEHDKTFTYVTYPCKQQVSFEFMPRVVPVLKLGPVSWEMESCTFQFLVVSYLLTSGI